jgi:GNAT superfamily N-acetyltransferase
MTTATIRIPPRLHDQRMTSTVLRNEEITRWSSRPAPDAHRPLQRELSMARLVVNLLAVTEGYRRRGVGTALMEAAEEWGGTGERSWR